jgi:uncharacterized protein YukJ
MAPTCGFVKCKMVSTPKVQSSRHKNEIQYHLHVTVAVSGAGGSIEQWDTAINVGTNDSDDLLQYKLIFDFHHSLVRKLKASAPGFIDLTRTNHLPALDFLRSDLLSETGPWRASDIMDGSDAVQPVASLQRLLRRAQAGNFDTYIFGRTYTDGDGIHDVHMNQGSQSSFLNNGVDDRNDHNDIWQDGAVIVDVGQPEMAAYFTVFTQQLVPTDELGNPQPGSHEVTDSDDGSLARSTADNS